MSKNYLVLTLGTTNSRSYFRRREAKNYSKSEGTRATPSVARLKWRIASRRSAKSSSKIPYY